MSMQPGEHCCSAVTPSACSTTSPWHQRHSVPRRALTSAKASRLALTAFGWYYAYDATIYLVTGVLQGTDVMGNVLLNIPT
jgi:hypothetical protein